MLLWNSTRVRSHPEVPGKEDQACEVYCCFLYYKCKTSFKTGGTAAKCTCDPVDVPAKLIRNRGREKKLTIAKFLCYCWFFLSEVNYFVWFVLKFYSWAQGVSAPRSLDSG